LRTTNPIEALFNGRIAVEIMAVPLAQLVRPRDVLAPVVEVGLLFAEPPRPQPVDEHPLPVFGSGGSYTRRTCHGIVDPGCASGCAEQALM
jgi:hypothetical protein